MKLSYKQGLLFSFLIASLLGKLYASVEPCQEIVIIFDIEDFMVVENRASVAWDLGFGIFNFISFDSSAKIIDKYFEHLRRVLPYRADALPVIRDGRRLPQIITDWLSNTQTADQARAAARAGLKNLKKRYGSNTSRSQAIAEHVFTPHRYAKTMNLVSGGFEIVQQCARIPHIKVCMMSNQNLETYREFCSHKEIRPALNFFKDNSVISGEVHMLKPDPAFFEYAFKKFNCDPNVQKVIYIDNEITNITAVQKLSKKNLHCIYCKDLNFKQIRSELRNLGVHI